VFSPDGSQLLSCCTEGRSVRLWNVDSGKATIRFRLGDLLARTGAISPDGRVAVLGGHCSRDSGPESLHTLVVFNLKTGRAVRRISAFRYVEDVAFVGGSKYIMASGLFDESNDDHLAARLDFSSLCVWDAQTGLLVRTFQTDRILPVDSFTIRPDGLYALSALLAYWDDDPLRVWDIETGSQARRLICSGGRGGPEDLAVSYDGKFAIAGGMDGFVRVWDIETGRELRRMSTQAKAVWSLACPPDRLWVMSGDSNGQFVIWDIETGKEIRRVPRHGGGDACLAWSPAGGQVAFGCVDGFIRLWKVPDLETQTAPAS
jgi:WD40 repeat protein